MMPPNISTMSDEAAERAHLKRLGRCFLAVLLPDMEPVILAELQQLLGVMEAWRGEVLDMLQYSHMFAPDAAGQSISFYPALSCIRFVYLVCFDFSNRKC